MNRRTFLKTSTYSSIAAIGLTAMNTKKASQKPETTESKDKRPNILFALADDWSWPHASIAGDSVIKTPTFDKVASEGVMFTNAFVTSPSCTPSRGSILTGQWHWRLEEGANLWSTLKAKFDVYPDLLEQSGYHVGYTRKGWGPGNYKLGGRTRNPAGPQYKSFKQFLDAQPAGKPFCFWFGSHDPHRKYKWQSGINSGMNLDDVTVPPCLPDNETVRTDICDYYWEVQRFDREVGEILDMLADIGELDNTLVVITGDNGWPFPRGKSNLYDFGTHVPLAICWGNKIKGERVVEDFVSLSDLAPTFLEIAGLQPIPEMTARSLMSILTSDKSGRVDPKRDHVLTGKERHVPCNKNDSGYPSRAIRTHDFLYIRNFKPERWPAGMPNNLTELEEDPDQLFERLAQNTRVAFADADASPTKAYMVVHRHDPEVERLYELAFEKRPAEELYDLRKDSNQLHNIANLPEYSKIKKKLSEALMAELKDTEDPRVLGNGDVFDSYPYTGRRRKNTSKK